MPSVAKAHADNFLDQAGPEVQVDSGSCLGQVVPDNDHVDAGDNQVDANSFIDNIELQFKKDPLRYQEFIRIMKAYRKSGKSGLDDREVVIRMSELLVGYPSLVKKFNAFLPNGYYLVPSDMQEEGESYITVKAPEGDTICPRECTKKPLVSGVSNSLP